MPQAPHPYPLPEEREHHLSSDEVSRRLDQSDSLARSLPLLGESAGVRGIRASNFRTAAPLIAAFLFVACFSSFAASKSPVADAAERSDRTGLRTLLKQRADVTAPQADGMTALHWAAYR